MATTWYVATTGNDSTGSGTSGAPYATIGKAVSVAASGDTIAVKSGTYTITSNISLTQASLLIQGYQTTPGDGGTKPLVTTATDTTDIFRTSSNGGVQIWDNLSISNTASIRLNGILQLSNNGPTLWWVVRNCILDGFITALNSDNIGSHFKLGNIAVIHTEIKNCTTSGVVADTGNIYISGSYLHNNAVHVTNPGSSSGTNSNTFTRTIFAASTGDGITLNGAVLMSNCVVANNTGKGLAVANTSPFVLLYNDIFYGNTWGVYMSGAYSTGNMESSRNNAWGSNSSGNGSNWTLSASDITLTANPFTNAGAGDFSLNSTAGGGAACKNAGLQWG